MFRLTSSGIKAKSAGRSAGVQFHRAINKPQKLCRKDYAAAQIYRWGKSLYSASLLQFVNPIQSLSTHLPEYLQRLRLFYSIACGHIPLEQYSGQAGWISINLSKC